jgi:hypothetical protein
MAGFMVPLQMRETAMIIKTYKPDDMFRLMTRDLREAARAVVFIGWTSDINSADIYEALKPVFEGKDAFGGWGGVRISRADVIPTDGSPVATLAIGFDHREEAIVGARQLESALCNVAYIDDISGCKIPAVHNFINIELWIGDVRVDYHPSSPQRASFKEKGNGDLT